MHVLLVNANPVVSRLFTLCSQEKTFFLEEVESIEESLRETYAFVFVDEESCNDDVLRALQYFTEAKSVLLASKKMAKGIGHLFDAKLKKPFLPSSICEVMSLEKESGHIFPLTANTQEEQTTQVLDESEVERIRKILIEEENLPPLEEGEAYEARKVTVIKEHLEADGLEIVTEDEYIAGLSQESSDIEEAVSKEMEMLLLEALQKMKVKKIKKLLKGAEVTIKIKFKDDL